VFCSTAKGLYLRGKQLLSEAMLEAFGRPQRMAFLSGPSFARQIVEGHPTAVYIVYIIK
jgi:glycerol-3-phosphate dehydrogenase